MLIVFKVVWQLFAYFFISLPFSLCLCFPYFFCNDYQKLVWAGEEFIFLT